MMCFFMMYFMVCVCMYMRAKFKKRTKVLLILHIRKKKVYFF